MVPGQKFVEGHFVHAAGSHRRDGIEHERLDAGPVVGRRDDCDVVHRDELRSHRADNQVDCDGRNEHFALANEEKWSDECGVMLNPKNATRALGAYTCGSRDEFESTLAHLPTTALVERLE